MERLYSVKQVAEMFGVDRWTIYQYIKRGELAAVRLGSGSSTKRPWRIKESSLAMFVDGKKGKK